MTEYMYAPAYPRTCPHCGKAFFANWNTRKYCSDECAKAYREKRRRETASERWKA